MLVDDVPDDGIEQRIAQKLQPLVVQRLALVVALARTLVGQGCLVVADVLRIEADNVAQLPAELFLIAPERQSQSLNDVLKVH